MITAQASSQGIASFFKNYKNELTFLANFDFVKNFNTESETFYRNYYDINRDLIETVTRVDEKGRIIFTYPYDASLIGSDLTNQKHIKQIMSTHEPVISDVFMSVQGFLAVAMHVPVFKGGEYAGSIAILVKIDKLGKEYLGKLKFRGTGSAWILTEGNIEIFCSIDKHTGRSYTENTKNNPAAFELSERLRNESQGTAKGVHNEETENGVSVFPEKYIVFYRIPLDNTFWNILISYKEDDIYASIVSFRNRLVLVFVAVFVLLAYYFYSLTKVRSVLKEEAKRKKAERILKESEQKYRTLVESINDGVLHTDTSGVIRFANNSIIEMLGFSMDELIGKMTFSDLILPEDRHLTNQKTELRLKGVSDKYEIRAVTKSGSVIWLSVNGTPLKDSGGNTVGSVGFFSNITERKRAEEELLKITHAIRQSPVAIVMTDNIGDIEFVNPKFEELTGYTLEEVKVLNPKILKSGDMTGEEYKILWNTITSGNEWTGEFHNKKKNGEFYWEKATISPVRNTKGEITHFLAIKEDISEKKNIIEELIHARDKAEESSRLKTNFLANMSHEIRTPLNGILGFAELLKSELDEKEQIDNINVIINSGMRLLDTLNMILNFSKLEAEKSSALLSEMKVCPIIDEVVRNFEAMAYSKGLYINREYRNEKITASIDERLLRNILNNLIKNAIVFTKTGGVTIIFDANEDYILLKVKDTGVGIAKENFGLIFEPFRQESEGFGRNFEGTGLGLSITKRYVEMLNGKINVESEKGKGSVFTVTLPIRHSETPASVVRKKIATASEQSQSQSAAGRKFSVLIVEDDRENLAYADRILRNIYKTGSAPDGFKAVEKARFEYYDIILMDINLGRGIDGVQAVKEIRKLVGYSDTPIIAVTAYAQESDRVEFLAAGCTHYISKPFTREELLTMLEEITKTLQ